VRLEDLRDLVADAHRRVQCGHGFLKDHADRAAAHVAHRLRVDLEKVATVEQRLATLDMDDRWQEAHQGLCAERFARSRLADDAEDLAGRQIEAEIVQGVGAVGAAGQAKSQVADRNRGWSGCVGLRVHRQYPSAMPSLRWSEAPHKTPRS
jgi:hypothetical protein